MTEIQKITEQVKEVMRMYKEEYPDVNMDRDYYPFKLAEEMGECIQAYLMLTDRGRQKGMSKEEIHNELAKEMSDVFGYLLAFADNEGIDLLKSIDDKWFEYLRKNKK